MSSTGTNVFRSDYDEKRFSIAASLESPYHTQFFVCHCLCYFSYLSFFLLLLSLVLFVSSLAPYMKCTIRPIEKGQKGIDSMEQKRIGRNND